MRCNIRVLCAVSLKAPMTIKKTSSEKSVKFYQTTNHKTSAALVFRVHASYGATRYYHSQTGQTTDVGRERSS
jgi:hypothetical protein